MRIGIDATILEDNEPTGIGLFTINLIKALTKVCDDLVVWTINGDLIKERIKKKLVLGRYKNSNICYLVRFFWAQIVLPFLIRKEKINIFFSPIPQGLIKCPVTQVIVFHDLLPLIWPKDFPLYTRLSFKCFLPWVAKNSDLILSVSEQTKEDIIHFYGINEAKIKVITECIDLTLFKSSLDKKETQRILDKYGLRYKEYILFVGTLTYRKNLHTLIKAYKDILTEHSNLKLVVVGKIINKKYYSYINDLIAKYNLLYHVLFLGYISAQELPHLYSGAKVFVYPSIYEGFGLPVLESICCGTPVISSRSVPCAQMINWVATFPPENRFELSNALKQVIKSNKFVSDEEIKRIKRLFSPDHMSSQIIREINSLL